MLRIVDSRSINYKYLSKKIFDLLIVSCLIIEWSILINGCGDPKIQIQDKRPKILIQDMIVADENKQQMIPFTYIIGKGDELEISYYIAPGIVQTEYLIDTEDTLHIDFYYYPVLSKTVKVRPDGFITLPRIGDVKAFGLKPIDLADKISILFKPYLSKPSVTVELIEFGTKIEKLKAAIYTTSRGQSKLVIVRPDGKISLPYINDVLAASLTTTELSKKLEKCYRKIVNDMKVTVAVLHARSYRTYIMGQVKRADYYELKGPITLTQLIARAGGFTNEANTHQVIVIHPGRKGQPKATVVDMNDTIGKGDICSDIIIQQYDVIYVPRTKLAQAALVGESLWRLIPLDFTISATYETLRR